MRFHRILLLTFLSTLLLVGFSSQISQVAAPNGAQYRMRIVGAPTTAIAVCTYFEVEIVVEPNYDGTFYDHVSFEVEIDTAYMTFDGYATNLPTGWGGSDLISLGSFRLDANMETGDPVYDSWTWARLLIHCEGPGSSNIVFDPNECVVEIVGDTTPKTYSLELEEPIVDQREGFSVGGIIMPTNAFVILAPYLTLVGLVATVSSVYLVWRKRKN